MGEAIDFGVNASIAALAAAGIGRIRPLETDLLACKSRSGPDRSADQIAPSDKLCHRSKLRRQPTTMTKIGRALHRLFRWRVFNVVDPNSTEDPMKILASALFAAGLLCLTSTAQALPAAPGMNAPTAVTDVGWRCGPGWHVNRWGHCVPSRRFYRPHRYWGPPRFHWHRHHWRPRHHYHGGRRF